MNPVALGRPYRIRVGLAGKVAAWALLFVALGCGASVRSPANPARPVSAFVIDYGRHTTLVLPVDEAAQSGVEFAYGDWDWYALVKQEWPDAIAALAWPSLGALGRRDIPVPIALPHVAEWIACEEIIEVRVGAAESAALLDRLEALYAAAAQAHGPPVYEPLSQLHFVQLPDERYWFFHNCNHVTKGWLEEMGCEVSGLAILADFDRAEPKDE